MRARVCFDSSCLGPSWLVGRVGRDGNATFLDLAVGGASLVGAVSASSYRHVVRSGVVLVAEPRLHHHGLLVDLVLLLGSDE